MTRKTTDTTLRDSLAERAVNGPPEPEHDVCQWFALCTNPATTTEPHPILGAVPICARCAAKVKALS